MAGRLKILRDRKAELLRQAREHLDSIDAAAGPTDEQKAKITDFNSKLEQTNGMIVAEEALATEERSMSGREDSNALQDRNEHARRDDDSKFKTLGDQLCAVAQSQINGEKDKRLQFQAAPAGASEGVGQDGGYLVQTDFTTELWQRTYEVGQLASRVRRIPVGVNSNGLKFNAIKESSRADGARWGGIEAFWEGEAGTLAGSRPKFRIVELKLKKLTGLAYATDELLQDAAALEGIIRAGFSEEFGFQLDTKIMLGTGAGQPWGYRDHGSAVTVDETIDGSTSKLQAADTVIVENIAQMYSRMWARSRPSAVWLINQSVEPQLMVMKIGTIPIYVPAGGVADAPFASLLGRPVVPVEQTSAVGSKGDVQFVDLSQYIMIEKGGINAASSMHVRFLTDEMAFRFIMRVDGMPAWDTPLTPYDGGATLSPFVILGERDGTAG